VLSPGLIRPARPPDRWSTTVPLHALRRPLAPTPLALPDLVALTRAVADEVRTGRHPVAVDAARRWYRRLRGDDLVDVWLIGWATEQAAELHDHGGAIGALTVVSGALAEERWTAAGLRRRRLGPGRSAGFGLGHVHEVVNPAPAPAVSVHAYSPPLTAMSYYAVRDGRLRRTRSELVEGTP
jgi:hypothetical protein